MAFIIAAAAIAFLLLRNMRLRKKVTEFKSKLQSTPKLISYSQESVEKTDTTTPSESAYTSQGRNSLLEEIPIAMAIFSQNTTLKYANNEFAAMWGLDESYLSQNPEYGDLLENLRQERKLPEQSDFRQFKQDNLDMFGNPPPMQKHEDSYYLPDGRVIHLNVTRHGGEFLFCYEDITEKVGLKSSYNTLRSVNKSTIDNLSEGVVVFGEDGRVKLTNPSYIKMWNLSQDLLDISATPPHINDLLEETSFLYEHPDDWESLKQEIIELSHKRTPSSQTLKRSDGSVLEWSCVPLPDGATLMTYNDITDSYRAEESLRAEKDILEEVGKLKTSFLTNISYELRSPLTSIKGFTEMLMKQYYGELEDKQREYVESIYESSETLARLIDSILDVASLDAGRARLDMDEFDVQDMLSSIASHVKINSSVGRRAEKDSDINIKLDCEKNAGRAYGDRKRLESALANMIEGSMSGENQEILLLASVTGDNVVCITMQNKSPIHRVSMNNTETNIAFTIAKDIVKMNNGILSVNNNETDGLTISCMIPRKRDAVVNAPVPLKRKGGVV